jgi:hypothetical protein
MPLDLTSADRMTADEVSRWIDTVKERGLASTEAEVAALIGKSDDTLLKMKKRGADRTTALACNAALMGLTPFGREPKGMTRMNRYKVTIPVTLTFEVDAHSHSDIEFVVGKAFDHTQPRDPLEGIKFVLPEINVQNAQIKTCVLDPNADIETEELYAVIKREWR